MLYTRVKLQNTDNNALQKKCDQWSEKYDKLSKKLDNTLEKLEEHKDKLRSLDIRNTNQKKSKEGMRKLKNKKLCCQNKKKLFKKLGVN